MPSLVLELEVVAEPVHRPCRWTTIAALRINLPVAFDPQVSVGVHVFQMDLAAVVQVLVVAVRMCST